MNTPKRILICGSRHFRDAKRIFQYISNLPRDTIIIEGEARGTDTIVWVCCEILGLKYVSFPADWAAYHKAAGNIRNKQMLVEGRPDLVIFYHDDLDESRGTINLLEMADKLKIPIEEGPALTKLRLFEGVARCMHELESYRIPTNSVGTNRGTK